MNIPNDGGWGKEGRDAGRSRSEAQLGAERRRYSLQEELQGFWRRLPRDWLSVGSAALFAAFCFGLGLLAARENGPPKDPLWIEQLPPEELPGSLSTSTPAQAAEQGTATQAAGGARDTSTSRTPAGEKPSPQSENYVASKTGSKYYLPNCAGAKRIKEENKVWFATKELAAAAGYQPAANCKGL